MPIYARTHEPLPDPQKAHALSSRPTFKLSGGWATLWLPDSGPAQNPATGLIEEEQDIEPADQLTATLLKNKGATPCPADALPGTGPLPDPLRDQKIAAAAAAIAKWAFDTYRLLVAHRLAIYNKYRKLHFHEAPGSVTLPKTRGQYRQACRLATEQLLRRDLPQVKGWDWNYWQTELPLFEIDLQIDLAQNPNDKPGQEDYDIVQHVRLSASVEIRQHRYYDTAAPALMAAAVGVAGPLIQPEWSSSSSSSSSSSFDPG